MRTLYRLLAGLLFVSGCMMAVLGLQLMEPVYLLAAIYFILAAIYWNIEHGRKP